jgi:3-isopropylmalate dehydrogenase
MIGSLAMCLRYSFGLGEAADLVDGAITAALAGGARTADIAGDGSKVLGTRAMAETIAAELRTRVA